MMATFQGRRTLLGVEADGLSDYLQEENARTGGWCEYLSGLIISGAIVDRVDVAGAKNIGNLTTCIKKCDTMRLAQVRELRQDFMAANDPLNHRNLFKLDEYLRLLDGNKLENVITGIENNLGVILFDGNKRAVANFEYALQKGDHTMPIFLIQASLPDGFVP